MFDKFLRGILSKIKRMYCIQNRALIQGKIMWSKDQIINLTPTCLRYNLVNLERSFATPGHWKFDHICLRRHVYINQHLRNLSRILAIFNTKWNVEKIIIKKYNVEGVWKDLTSRRLPDHLEKKERLGANCLGFREHFVSGRQSSKFL